jgi:diaminopimelate epimerase
VSEVEFYKMTGSGNDFVVLDVRRTAAENWGGEQIKQICDRRDGVGADGLVLLTARDGNAVQMEYWNSDGSRAALCGNAALCSAHLSARLALVSGAEFRLLTDAGPVKARVSALSGQPAINLPDVDLSPNTDFSHLRDPGERWITLLTVGVPHLVVHVDDVARVDLLRRGSVLRSHPQLGPDGANVNFVGHSADPQTPWTFRTYERGVEDETLACGTGAVATALALSGREGASFPLGLRSRGGRSLEVDADLAPGRASNVWLRGEGRVVFRGLWETPN